MGLLRGQMLRGEATRRETIERARASVASDTGACGQCKLAIGQCSCTGNGGGSRSVMLAVQAPSTMPADGSARSPDFNYGGMGVGVNQFAAGNWVIVPQPANGAYSPRLCDKRGVPVGWSRAMQEVMAMGKQEPYLDPAYDWANMDVIYSDLITATPGVPIDVDVSPQIGTFAGFYYNVLAVDPATQVEQVDWRITRPSVPGCPTPCATPGPILAQFVRRGPDQCCGIPLTSFLDERSRGVPLRTPFTNNQAAGDLLVQIEVRGYCCSDRIC